MSHNSKQESATTAAQDPSQANGLHPTDSSARQYWLDNPRNVRSIVLALAVICLLLFAADFLYHKHTHFGFEQWHGFYAWYGFISYCAIVLSAKQLRRLLKRDEDYYQHSPSESSTTTNSADSAS